MRAVAIAVMAALTAGCSTGTLVYEPLAPSRQNAEAALAATAASHYLGASVGQETLYRTTEEMVQAEGLSGCLSNGVVFRLSAVLVQPDGITGQGAGGALRTLRWDEIRAIGRPVDRRVFGYFPVREDNLDCTAR